MIDDRNSQFRTLYKTMGLPRIHYLISQIISFFFINLFALTTFQVMEVINNYFFSLSSSSFNQEIFYRFMWNVMISFQATTTTIIFSYFFKSPTLGRDINILLHFAVIYIDSYFYVKKEVIFLKYFLPYYSYIIYIGKTMFF